MRCSWGREYLTKLNNKPSDFLYFSASVTTAGTGFKDKFVEEVPKTAGGLPNALYRDWETP